eukprot:TRINITY_DN578_c0_g2_i3.p1 TRINITY_DN578_c0_g2~~TRINITY_DN578_c0_g2_i3.p1  ORF type:complete len:466 (-),score=75.58 TRINITY_DN578_c0_g2_i3:4462-5859(-)
MRKVDKRPLHNVAPPCPPAPHPSTKGMKSYMRLLGFILSASIVLALFAVSYESEYLSLWGGGRNPSQRIPHVAEAVPLTGDAVDKSGASGSEEAADEVVRDAEMEKAPVEEAKQEQSAPAEQEVQEPPSAGEASKQEETDGNSEPADEAKDDPKPEAPAQSEPLSQEKADEHTFDPTDKPEYHTKSVRRTRAKTFLVVFMGHSGSTAFITELRTHSEFLVEKLEPLDHHEYERNTDLAYEHAKELMDRGIEKGKIPGFKIRPYHILNKPELWRKFVRDYDCRVIWQYRENVVKQAIGEYRNRYLNDSSVVEGLSPKQKPCEAGSDQKCTFRIEDMRFLHSLMTTMSGSDELLASAVRSLERNEDMSIVKYEDYLYRRERTMKETFDFLGVDWQETAAQRKKASPDNLCKMVTNFQEVCDRFLPCQLWRPFLYDDVNDCRCKPGNWKNFDPSFCQRGAWFQKSKSS